MRVHCAVQRPSTKSALSVTKEAASEDWKTAAPAISCNSPQRPTGIFSTKALYLAGSSSNCRFNSVAKGPGHPLSQRNHLVIDDRWHRKADCRSALLEGNGASGAQCADAGDLPVRGDIEANPLRTDRVKAAQEPARHIRVGVVQDVERIAR